MPKKLTSQEFIDRSNNIHNFKFNYSKINYINNSTKIIIICQNNHEFLQTPANHLRGDGCPTCRSINIGSLIKKAEKTVIEQMVQVHGNRYDYSKVKYNLSKEKIEIICRKHGSFFQRPTAHMKGHGCIDCANEQFSINNTYSNEWFVETAKSIHGDVYDYSISEYKGANERVDIICRRHGKFSQFAGHHMRGRGCKRCKSIISEPETEWLDYLKITKEYRQIYARINNK